MHGLAEQLLDRISCHLGDSRVHKGGTSIQVQPINPLTCRVQNQFVLATELFDRGFGLRELSGFFVELQNQISRHPDGRRAMVPVLFRRSRRDRDIEIRSVNGENLGQFIAYRKGSMLDI